MMSSIDRPLSGDVMRFDLQEERQRVADPALLEPHGRTARTLLKEGPLRVTLVMVRAGGRIDAHHSAGPITVHVLDGDIRFRVAGHHYRLTPGDLLAVGAGLEHDVASDGGGTFLLTVVHTK
jgi:quercetin dioxygenase-like cupin family protein